MSYRNATNCRACDGTDLIPVVDLGNQPLANNFVKPGEPRQGFYPLKINYCATCGLAQLSAVVDRDLLYRHYAYVSSASATMQRHYDRLFKDIESETEGRRIFEIGSNNGGLLKFAKNRGWQVQGIDPALNLAEIANANDIPTVPMFFTRLVAENSGIIIPSVVLARHVFAHIDDWQDFMSALEWVSDKDTLICIEVPYAVDMLRKVEFDTAYHEHLSYITLKPIVRLLKQTPFHIHRISRYSIHGGAILIMLRHNDSRITPHLSAEEMVAEEQVECTDWTRFALRTTEKINDLRNAVMDLVAKGKVVSAFGASAKCTVLLNACQLDLGQIQFVTDNSPLKPGKLVPGTSIPVIEESEMLSYHPNYSIMSCWNFKSEVMDKMKRWQMRGGKWIIPGEGLEIV